MKEFLKPFDNICPQRCSECEEKESLVIFPQEESFWNYTKKEVSTFLRNEEGYLYLPVSGPGCPFYKNKSCSEYKRRPFDCRMFPYYPIFDIYENAFVVNKEMACQFLIIPQEAQEDFRQAVIAVSDLLNINMPISWKIFYNLMNAHVTAKILTAEKV